MDLFTDLCGKMRLIPSMYNTRTFNIFLFRLVLDFHERSFDHHSPLGYAPAKGSITIHLFLTRNVKMVTLGMGILKLSLSTNKKVKES